MALQPKDLIIGGVAITALGVGVIALTRRQLEIKMLDKIENQLKDLRTAYRFAEIIEHYHEGEKDEPDSASGNSEG